jgi:hypothetical protein
VAHIIEPIEAVIISGPRRGEIIRLPAETVAEMTAADVDIEMLNGTLDLLITAIEKLSTEIRATSTTLQKPVETA